MTNLGSLLIAVGADLSAFNASMGDLNGKLAQAEKDASNSWSGFEALAGRMTSVGAGLTAAVTAPLIGIAAAGTTAFAGFEAALNKVSALGDITGKDLTKLHDIAIKLGADTQFSAKQAADGMAELAAAGYNTEQIMQAMPGMLSLAAAGQLSIADASTVATDAIAQFALKATDTGRVADVLAKAAAAGKDSVSGIGTALSHVGGVAKSAGLSLEATAAALTELANAGDRGEKAGVRLREILISLSTATDPLRGAGKILAGLGVDAFDAGGKLKPLADIIDQLKQSNLNLAQAAGIVGKEGASGLLNLVTAGGPALRSLTTDLENSTGAANKMAGTLNSGLNGALEKMKGSIETAGIAIGEALAPTLITVAGLIEAAANKAAEFVKWFGTLPEPVRLSALAAAAFAAAIGPVVLGIGLGITAVTNIAGAFTLLSPIVAGIATTALPAIMGAFTTFATVTIPAAVTALGELSVALVAQAETSLARFAATTIPNAITALTTFATTGVPAAITALTTFATVTVPQAITAAVTFATTSIPAATAAMVEFASTGVAGAAASLSGMATAAIPAVTAAIAALGIAATTAAAAFAGWKLGEWAYNAFPAVKKLGDGIADLIAKIPGVTFAIEKLSGASDAQAHAATDQAFASQKLADAQARAKQKATDLSTATKAITDSHKQATRASDDLGQSHKTTAENTYTLARRSEDLFTVSGKLKSEHDSHVRTLEALREKYSDVSKIVPVLTQTTEDLDQAVQDASSSAARHVEQINLAKDAWNNYVGALNGQLQAAISPVQAVEDAFKTLHISSSASLQGIADKAHIAYETIKNDGTSSAKDLDAAWVAYEKARIAAAEAAGEQIPRRSAMRLQRWRGNSPARHRNRLECGRDSGLRFRPSLPISRRALSKTSGKEPVLSPKREYARLSRSGKRCSRSSLSRSQKPARTHDRGYLRPHGR
jgi:TP901 family phage tail tape measure protein